MKGLLTSPGLHELLAEPCSVPVAQAMEEGMVPVGYTCSYVPEVMLSVGKLFPVRMRAPGVTGTETADTYMPSTLCSYTRSILEYFMEGRYDFLGGWVFAASCDHLRRLYDNMDYLAKPEFIHVLDVPHKSTDEGVEWMREELDIFRKALSGHFGVIMDDDALARAIGDYNGHISLINSIGVTRKLSAPPVSGTEFHRLMLASMTIPPKAFAGIAREMKEELNDRPGIDGYRARLMVMGGQLDDPEYIAVIESQGGLVVADRFCTGSIPHLTPVPESRDPLTALARHVFARTDCPRMMGDFSGRIERIVNAVDEYRVDGVVIETIKFCDIWGYEAAAIVSALRERRIPVLRLEREYRLTGEGQLRTRIQAFLESMGK